VILVVLGLITPYLQACSCSSRGGLDGKTKILRKVLTAKGKSLDPHRQFDAASSEVTALLFDSLFMTHYLKRPYEFVPNLAAAMPEFSADGKLMTIRLRDDVRFQDGDCFPQGRGRPLLARDVVYSFTRFADPFVNANSYSLIEGLIVGLDDARKKMEALGENHYQYGDFPDQGDQSSQAGDG
jgi:ABC-type transport system substrate-binding protein